MMTSRCIFILLVNSDLQFYFLTAHKWQRLVIGCGSVCTKQNTHSKLYSIDKSIKDKTREITNFDFGNTVRLKALCESTAKDHTNNYVVQRLKS